MLVVMSAAAGERQIRGVVEFLQRLKLEAHLLPGPTRTAIGITGDTDGLNLGQLELMPGVEQLIRITKPYKLASREMNPADTVIALPQATFGPGHFPVIA